MDRSSVLSELATLTAGLRPTGTTTAADLNAARAALASSLLAHAVDPTTAITGLPTAPAASPSSEDLSALKHILDTAAAATSSTPVPLVFPRSLPAVAVGSPALTPAPVSGMLPESIGPFVDSLGALHWFDIFPPVQQTANSRTPSTVPFLLLPFALRAGPVPTTLPVAAGTLCMEAQLPTSASPAGGYAGIAISGGTLELSSVATASAAGLQVDAATTLTLTITLGGSPGPPGGGDPGADGGAVVANMPATVTFVFTHTGAQLTAAGDASLIAYGSTIGLQFETAAPGYDAMLGQLLVPFKPDTTSFSALSVLSNLFQVTGTAKLDFGAWAIPVAVTPPAQLGAAASPGLPALMVGAGLQASWSGISGGSTALRLILLEASAGLLGLIARIQNTSQFSMQIGLWPATPTSTERSSIDASFPSGALLYYESAGSFARRQPCRDPQLRCGSQFAYRSSRRGGRQPAWFAHGRHGDGLRDVSEQWGDRRRGCTRRHRTSTPDRGGTAERTARDNATAAAHRSRKLWRHARGTRPGRPSAGLRTFVRAADAAGPLRGRLA